MIKLHEVYTSSSDERFGTYNGTIPSYTDLKPLDDDLEVIDRRAMDVLVKVTKQNAQQVRSRYEFFETQEGTIYGKLRHNDTIDPIKWDGKKWSTYGGYTGKW